jgi:hypothetical protein
VLIQDFDHRQCLSQISFQLREALKTSSIGGQSGMPGVSIAIARSAINACISYWAILLAIVITPSTDRNIRQA